LILWGDHLTGNHIELVKGKGASIPIILTYRDGSDYIQTPGTVLRFAVKRSYNHTSPVLVKIISDDLKLDIRPEETAALSAGSYVYALQVTYSDGNIDTAIVDGVFTVYNSEEEWHGKPQILPNPIIVSTPVDDLGKSFKYKDGELIVDLISGIESVKQWFDLMLRQRPGLTPIYNFENNPPGIDIIKLYDLPRHLMTAEIQRHIVNTARYCPAVEYVRNFKFSQSGRELTVEFTAALVGGEEVRITYDI